MVDVPKNVPEKEVPFEKKNSIGSRLIGFAKALVRASPKIAENESTLSTKSTN